eukprot:1169773-Amphidinium_carterae.1
MSGNRRFLVVERPAVLWDRTGACTRPQPSVSMSRRKRALANRQNKKCPAAIWSAKRAEEATWASRCLTISTERGGACLRSALQANIL